MRDFSLVSPPSFWRRRFVYYNADKTMKDILNLLKKVKLKATIQRRMILKIFHEHHQPISADDIFSSLKGEGLDLATIYRAINSFERAGLVRRVDLHKDANHYERTDSKHHHHITCKDCGRIEDFDICGVEVMAKRALKKSSFAKIHTHSLELFGICKKCT